MLRSIFQELADALGLTMLPLSMARAQTIAAGGLPCHLRSR
jgi:hypothetical protein